jgi:hypothetical protein
VLFSGQDKKTHLIDMNGHEVQRWDAEGFPPVLLDPALTGGQRGMCWCSWPVRPAPATKATACATSPSVNWTGTASGVAVGRGRAARRMPTRRRWKARPAQVPGGSAKQHHDWRRLTNGNTLVLANLVHPVAGFAAPQVLDDVIYEVTPQGDIVWQWVASEHLKEFGFAAAR